MTGSLSTKFKVYYVGDEAVKRSAAGILVIAPDGTALLARRAPGEGDYAGYWAMPGGGVEPGETPDEAARRELSEEMGLSMLECDQLPIMPFDSRDDNSGLTYTTFVHFALTEFEPVINREHDAWGWFPLTALPQPLHPGVIATLRDRLGEAIALDSEFREEDHPRRDDGKFGSGSGGAHAATTEWHGKADSAVAGHGLEVLSSTAQERSYQSADGKTFVVYLPDDTWAMSSPATGNREGKGEADLAAAMKEAGQPGAAPAKPAPKAEAPSILARPPREDRPDEVAPHPVHTDEVMRAAAPPADHAQAAAINWYTGYGAQRINDTLREHDGDTSVLDRVSDAPAVAALDAYLAKSSIPEDIVLFRHVDGDYADDLRHSMTVGTEFEDQGYVSTSIRHNSYIGGELRVIISARKGRPGASMRHYSEHPDEDEVLLPRGSRFRVTAFDPERDVMRVELL